MNTTVATSNRAANTKYSMTWFSIKRDSATIRTKILPKATTRHQHADNTDFIDSGACEYENDKPLIENLFENK